MVVPGAARDLVAPGLVGAAAAAGAPVDLVVLELPHAARAPVLRAAVTPIVTRDRARGRWAGRGRVRGAEPDAYCIQNTIRSRRFPMVSRLLGARYGRLAAV